MKKMFKPTAILLLTTAMAFNASADTKAAASSKDVASEVAAVTAPVGSKAEAAKKAYDELMAKNNLFLKRLESFSFVEKMDLTVENYTVGDNQSEVTQIFDMTFKRSNRKKDEADTKTSKTVTKYAITYNDELTAKGIVAHIESTESKVFTLVNGKNIENNSEKGNETQDVIVIYTNGNIEYKATSKATDDTPGMIFNYHTNMNFLDKGYGKFDGQLTNLQNNDKDAQFDSLNFEGEYSAENGLEISSTSPILSKKDGKLTTINGLTFRGKMTDIAGLNRPLPSFAIIAKGIATEVKQGVTATMDVMSFEVETKASKSDGVDLSSTFVMKPSGTWMKQISQDKLNLTNISAKFSIDNLPVSIVNEVSDEMVNHINESYDDESNEKTNDDAAKKRINEMFAKNAEVWFAEMQKKGSGPSLELSFDSDKGNGFLNASSRLKDVGLTIKDLQKSQPTPELFLSLFDVKGKSGLPAELIEALKVQMYLAMAYQKKGDTYVSDIETRDNKLMVNDVPFDLSMFFPKKVSDGKNKKTDEKPTKK